MDIFFLPPLESTVYIKHIFMKWKKQNETLIQSLPAGGALSVSLVCALAHQLPTDLEYFILFYRPSNWDDSATHYLVLLYFYKQTFLPQNDSATHWTVLFYIIIITFYDILQIDRLAVRWQCHPMILFYRFF